MLTSKKKNKKTLKNEALLVVENDHIFPMGVNGSNYGIPLKSLERLENTAISQTMRPVKGEKKAFH